MSKTLSSDSERRLIALYRAGGMSLRQLGERFGLTHEGVRRVLIRNQVQLNPPHVRLPGMRP